MNQRNLGGAVPSYWTEWHRPEDSEVKVPLPNRPLSPTRARQLGLPRQYGLEQSGLVKAAQASNELADTYLSRVDAYNAERERVARERPVAVIGHQQSKTWVSQENGNVDPVLYFASKSTPGPTSSYHNPWKGYAAKFPRTRPPNFENLAVSAGDAHGPLTASHDDVSAKNERLAAMRAEAIKKNTRQANAGAAAAPVTAIAQRKAATAIAARKQASGRGGVFEEIRAWMTRKG